MREFDHKGWKNVSDMRSLIQRYDAVETSFRQRTIFRRRRGIRRMRCKQLAGET